MFRLRGVGRLPEATMPFASLIGCRHMWKLSIGGLIGFLCACGGSSTVSIDASTDAGGDVSTDAATRTVSGHYVLHLVTPSGIVDLPSDLSHASIEVLVPPEFTPIYGSGSSDGTFTIPNVPVGEYYFVVGTHYFVASDDTVALDPHAVGRPTATFVNQPTNLTFTVTGMDAWQGGDELELYSPQSGTLAYDLEADATAGSPTSNDTALNGMVYDLRYAARNTAPSAAAGDSVTVAHLEKATDGVRTYSALAQAFMPAGLTVTNGGSASINDAFSAVPRSQTLTATWDRPAYAAELAARFPHAAAENWSTFAVTALQSAAALGFYDNGPDLLFFAPGYTTDTSPVSASWPYGDPFPADWGRIVWNRYYRYRSISLPGASPTAIFAKLQTYRDLSTLASDPVFEPGVGVVVNPTINGSDALMLGTMMGVTATPTLAWQPPTTGVPSKYYVTIYSVINVNGATTLKKVALIETHGTQVVIPPTLLVSGQPSVFDISVRASSADLVANPYAYALPEGYSSVMTTMALP
jgi:hypothetical protein